MVLFLTFSAIAQSLTLPTSGIKLLEIESGVTTVTIKGTESTIIESKLSSATTTISPEYFSYSLTTEGDIAKLVVLPLKSSQPTDQINLEVTIPAALALKLNDGGSHVTVENLNGKVEIFDGEGDLTINDVKWLTIIDKGGNIRVNNRSLYYGNVFDGLLEITDGSGEIFLDNLTGQVELIDRSGNIVVNNVKGDLNVVDGSGNLTVNRVSRNLTIDDGSGDIEYNFIGKVTILEAGTGRINSQLPPASGELPQHSTALPLAKPSLLPIPETDYNGQLREGIYLKVDNGAIQKLHGNSPIDIAPGAKVVMAVYNYKNMMVPGKTLAVESDSLIPQLVRNIGEDAQLRIDINNSANMETTGSLVIGLENGIEPSLISNLICGDLGTKVQIEVNINNSGNVTLAGSSSSLKIGGGSLIEEIVNSSTESDLSSILNGYLDLKITDSANVYSKGATAIGSFTIEGGQLENENVDYGIAYSVVKIKKLRVANVTAARNSIHKGELIDETLDSRSIPGSLVEITLEDSANIKGDELTIVDGELIDESVDTERLESSNITVSFIDTARVETTGRTSVTEGELIDEVIDMESINKTNLTVSFTNSANVTASEVKIFGGELIDETLDGEEYHSSGLNLIFKNSSNIKADLLTVEEGELIDEAIDGESFFNTQIRISFNKTAEINATTTLISGGELIDEALDIEDSLFNTTILLSLDNTANVNGTALTITGGELVDELVDASNGKGTTLFISVSSSANFTEQGPNPATVSITGGELMDELIDVGGSLELVNSSVTIRSSANVTTDTLKMKEAQLIDEVIDSKSISGTVLRVNIFDSVNATAGSFNLCPESRIIDNVIESSNGQTNSTVYYFLQNSAIKTNR